MSPPVARILALLALLLGIAASAPAAASAWYPPTDKPLNDMVRVKDSLRIARAFWRVDLPTGPARVYAATDAELELATGTYGALAAAPLKDSRIWLLDEGLDVDDYAARIDTCSDLVHEYGHALGVGHAPEGDTRAVMHPGRENNGVVYECYRRFMPKGMAREWREGHGRPSWLVRPPDVEIARAMA